MFSTSRRCTASSSAIKMVAAMAFPARYNYLSRIGALSPMAINVLLRGVIPASFFCYDYLKTANRFEHYGLARFGSPQIFRSPQIRRKKLAGGQSQRRETAGMESGRSVFRNRRAGSGPRPRPDGRGMHGARTGLQGQ